MMTDRWTDRQIDIQDDYCKPLVHARLGLISNYCLISQSLLYVHYKEKVLKNLVFGIFSLNHFIDTSLFASNFHKIH